MPYRLRTGESVQCGIRRVLSEQIERSLGEIADMKRDRADTIHQVRKRCKKIRAALQLVRGALGDAYSKEYAWYRDASRRIADVRDAEAMIETCDCVTPRPPMCERDGMRRKSLVNCLAITITFVSCVHGS
jgi:CHAD domain-containing protein